MKRLIKRQRKHYWANSLNAETLSGDRSTRFVENAIGRTASARRNQPTKAYRLTYKDSRQKTRIVYVAKDRLPEVRRLLANYSRLREIVEQTYRRKYRDL